MTTARTQTLYAPNPPQIDEPWLKTVLLIVAAVAVIALAVAGS